MKFVFWAHVFSCWLMVGVIWVVQLLLYPFFKRIGENEFAALHEFHMNKITWIVAPLMVVELASALGLFWCETDFIFFWNLISVIMIWLLTVFWNVPTHTHLNFKSGESKKNLVSRNWPRTFIWSLRAVFLFLMIVSRRVVEFM